jgi:hypothetical protein
MEDAPQLTTPSIQRQHVPLQTVVLKNNNEISIAKLHNKGIKASKKSH